MNKTNGGGRKESGKGIFQENFPFLLVAYETLLVCQVLEKLIF